MKIRLKSFNFDVVDIFGRSEVDLDTKSILVFVEDIARHNAIDKILGECILENVETEGRIIMTSGRISSEILLKAAKRNIPIIISKSAPTDLAVKSATDLGMTLIGFVRGRRMNVHAECNVAQFTLRDRLSEEQRKKRIGADGGFVPLPIYHEPPETPYSAPELAKDYPLILTSWHNVAYHHSDNRHLATLRGIEPEPVVEIHPETARGLGIEDGDQVYIETKRGRIKQRAVLTVGIDPGVVGVSYCWWFPEQGVDTLHGWRESNINILTESQPPYNPQIGSTNLRGILCRVYKVPQ